MCPLVINMDKCVPKTEVVGDSGSVVHCLSDHLLRKVGHFSPSQRLGGKMSHSALPSCWEIFHACLKGHIFKTRLKVKLKKIK